MENSESVKSVKSAVKFLWLRLRRAGLLVLLGGYSVCANRHRTALRMITFKVTDASSLSTIRQEQAGKLDTCFWVSSCSP